MKPWKYKISIVGFYEKDPEDFPSVAKDVHSALTPIMKAYPNDAELEIIYGSFYKLANFKGGSVSEFDNVLERLYAWGDVDRKLWVGTP